MDISYQSELCDRRDSPCPPRDIIKKTLSVQTVEDYIALKKEDPELCCDRD